MRPETQSLWLAVGGGIALAQAAWTLSFGDDGSLASTNGQTNLSRPVSRAHSVVRGEVYDIEAKGLPRFVKSDYIELGKIERISRFRSGVGHDYSDAFETCRSMKHYFQPSNGVDWAAIQIRSPITGQLVALRQEQAGTAVEIQSAEFPAFRFTVFHVRMDPALSVGSGVRAGQRLGTHVGTQTMSDIAVRVSTPAGQKLVSYFDVMSGSLFATYQSRGLTSRTNAIITKEARDADPLTCSGETFAGPGKLPNWITLR